MHSPVSFEHFHRGTVIKMGVPRMLQTQRLFRCGQCGEIFTVTADYEQYYRLDRPAACPNFRDPERRCKVRESTPLHWRIAKKSAGWP